MLPPRPFLIGSHFAIAPGKDDSSNQSKLTNSKVTSDQNKSDSKPASESPRPAGWAQALFEALEFNETQAGESTHATTGTDGEHVLFCQLETNLDSCHLM